MSGRETPARFAMSSIEVLAKPNVRKQWRPACRICARRFSSSTSPVSLGMVVVPLQTRGKIEHPSGEPVSCLVAEKPIHEQDQFCVERCDVTSLRAFCLGDAR